MQDRSRTFWPNACAPRQYSRLNMNDEGRAVVVNNPIYKGAFKVPSLRNIAITPPYMHDGRFRNIDEVLDHYSHGIKLSPSLSPKLKEGGIPIKMDFSDEERSFLIAFLNSLTDQNITTDPSLSDPFQD